MDETQAADLQDSLRSPRLFVQTISGAMSDQSYAGQDGVIGGRPQFYTVGPYSTSIEGRPVAVTGGGGIVISPGMVMLGLGVAIALMWKR
jgi:hypothetical protein